MEEADTSETLVTAHGATSQKIIVRMLQACYQYELKDDAMIIAKIRILALGASNHNGHPNINHKFEKCRYRFLISFYYAQLLKIS